eukprot:scaffold267044_cov15-Tisochrysis_lutea.AAC.1
MLGPSGYERNYRSIYQHSLDHNQEDTKAHLQLGEGGKRCKGVRMQTQVGQAPFVPPGTPAGSRHVTQAQVQGCQG